MQPCLKEPRDADHWAEHRDEEQLKISRKTSHQLLLSTHINASIAECCESAGPISSDIKRRFETSSRLTWLLRLHGLEASLSRWTHMLGCLT